VIESGKTVKVHYKGTLPDGTVFDSSEGKDPLAFEIGAEQVITGFENAVVAMDVGETKTFTLPCTEAYGEMREEMVGLVPRAQMPDDLELELGMVLSMESDQGSMPVRVVDLDDEHVTLDANHPLAGQDLTFELTLVEVA
jgi:FKBP-type peptidyl-prolyl cis-trans isomerase 2